MPAILLALSGGAPVAPAISGALVALDEKEVRYDAISASGAGIIQGLLYAAPAGGDRRAALRAVTELGIHDWIYKYFPVNYKIFKKPGAAARAYDRIMMPWLRMFPSKSSEQSYFKDLMWLGTAAFAPSWLSYDSLGLCAPVPQLEESIDFSALADFPCEFFINAYNIREQKIRIFPKEEITPGHVRAALAFPLLYPPFELDGDYYYEGASVDTINLEGLLRSIHMTSDIAQKAMKGYEDILYRLAEETGYGPSPDEDAQRQIEGELLAWAPQLTEPLSRRRELSGFLRDVRDIIVFDTISDKHLIRKPRDVYDAWVMSIMVPAVSMGAKDIELFELKHLPKYPGVRMHHLDFASQVPAEAIPTVLDWSSSNMRMLFHAGYRAGKSFYSENQDWLHSNTDSSGA